MARKTCCVLLIGLFYYVTNIRAQIGLVYYGENAEENSFRHAAFLAILHTNDEAYAPISCGASVINQRVLLSAAHCFQHHIIHVLVLVGAVSVSDAHALKYSHYVKHEEFKETVMFKNDIALVFLDEDIDFKKNVKKVILLMNYPKSDVYMTGWGMTKGGQNENLSIRLQYSKQTLYNGTACKTKMTLNISSDLIYCSKSQKSTSNQVTSQGDSGNALTAGDYIQIGIVSGVTLEKKFTIYTRVSAYLDWIKTTVKSSCKKG